MRLLFHSHPGPSSPPARKEWSHPSRRFAVATWVALFCSICASGCAPGTDPLPEGECGDGVLNKGEECDMGDDNSDIRPDGCRTDCRLAYCGDHVVDTGEVCDSSDLQGNTCLDMGYLEGRLGCTDECELDVSGCSTCGDGSRTGLEQCDGQDLGTATCEEMGFDSGVLGCDDECELDVSGCIGGCGNGLLEAGEECDGGDVGSSTCQQLGFESGELACLSGCELDLSGCVGGCGNGVVEPGETCDDGNDRALDGCTDCVSGDGTFEPGSFVDTCMWPMGLALSDVDGDGARDLVVGCGGGIEGRGGVAVHLGAGDGTFGASHLRELGAPVVGLDTADMNGDGVIDIVCSLHPPPQNGDAPGAVAVLAGLGDGTFDASQPVEIGSRPGELLIAELTDDGALDVAVTDTSQQRIHILAGDGAGQLAPHTFLYNYGGPAALDSADLDLDSHTDLVTVRQSYDLVVVFLSSGGGAFSSPISRMVGDRPTALSVGSHNGDTFPDLAVASSDDGTISVLAGFGDGQFAYPTEIQLDPGIGDLKTGYFDGDSSADLVVAATSTDEIRVVLGDGQGGLEPAEAGLATCDSPAVLEIADLDGDGIWDVAAGCSYVDTVAIHIGRKAEAN